LTLPGVVFCLFSQSAFRVGRRFFPPPPHPQRHSFRDRVQLRGFFLARFETIRAKSLPAKALFCRFLLSRGPGDCQVFPLFSFSGIRHGAAPLSSRFPCFMKIFHFVLDLPFFLKVAWPLACLPAPFSRNAWKPLFEGVTLSSSPPPYALRTV